MAGFSVPGVAFPFHFHSTPARQQQENKVLLSNDRACHTPRLDGFQALPRRGKGEFNVFSGRCNAMWRCDRSLCFDGLARGAARHLTSRLEPVNFNADPVPTAPQNSPSLSAPE